MRAGMILGLLHAEDLVDVGGDNVEGLALGYLAVAVAPRRARLERDVAHTPLLVDAETDRHPRGHERVHDCALCERCAR